MIGRLPPRRFLDRPDRPRRRCALGFSLLTLVLGFVYLLWLTPLVFKNRGIPDFLFLAAETLSFLLLGLMAVDVWHLRSHRPEGLSPDRQWPVDVFIPCCGEPLEVIRTTLLAVQRIAYQPMQVRRLPAGKGALGQGRLSCLHSSRSSGSPRCSVGSWLYSLSQALPRRRNASRS